MNSGTDRASRLIDFVAETAWVMGDRALGNMLTIVQRHDSGVKLTQAEIDAVTHSANAAASTAGSAGKPYQVVGSVAVIPVGGVIAKYASQVNGISSPRGTSVQSIKSQVQAAIDDPDVASWLLHIDSPGGSVMGMWDAMDFIRGAASQKPGWAYVSDLAASGGYAFASQMLKIYQSAGAQVGSIGVYCVVVDASRAAQNEGYEVIVIGTGGVKGAGTMGTRIGEDFKNKVQGEMNALLEEFVTRVAAGRRMSVEQVKALATGEMWIGQAAVDKGLTDGSKPLGEVLAEMNRTYRVNAAGRNPGLMSNSGGGVSAAAGAVVVSGMVAGGTGQESVMENGQQGAGGGSATGGNGNTTPGALAAAAGGITQEQVNQAAQAAVAADRARAAGIRAWGEKYGHIAGVKEKVEAAAAGTTSLEAFEKDLTTMVLNGNKPLGIVGTIEVGTEGFKRKTVAMENMLAARACPNLRENLANGGELADRLANRLGYEAVSGLSAANVALKGFREAESSGVRGMRMSDMARACVAAIDPSAAGRIGYDDVELFRLATQRGALAGGAHTTSDFPTILSNVANKSLLVQFEEEPITWKEWVSKGVNNDYKPRTMVNLSDAPDLLRILEGDTAKLVSFNERGSTISVNPYGIRFAMTVQMMINDDVNAFALIPGLFGASARRLPEILVYQMLELATGTGPLMEYDSTRLITSGHRNLMSSAALGYGTLQTMITSFLTQRGYGNDTTIKPVQPAYVIVPPALQFTADLLFQNQYAPGTTSDANLVKGKMKPIVAPRLTASSTRWWGAGTKNNSSLEVSFLGGQEVPRIDIITDGDPLKQEWQVTLMGCGVGARNHENIAMNSGGG